MSLEKIKVEKLYQFVKLSSSERKVAGEMNFAYFFTYYFAPYVNYKYADFHYDMFEDCHDLVDGKINEAAWIAFRESAKTSIAKGFITYLICYKKRQYINVDSYDKENAERILFDVVLELQTNSRILKDFGHLYNAKRKTDEVSQKRVSNFLTTNGVRVEAHSTQESVRGRLSKNHRPDAVILDDFETKKTSRSEVTTQSIRSHIEEFQGGLASNSLVLYLGNYISEFGNVSWLESRAKDNKKIRFRNIPVMVGEELAWPDKYCLTDKEAITEGKVSIESIKSKLYSPDEGNNVFMAEMMNQPIDEANQVFKKEMFQYIEYEDVMKLKTNVFLILDTAVSKQKNSDNTGFSLIFVDKENNWYIKAWGTKVDPKEMINNIFALQGLYSLTAVGIEKTMYFDVIKPFLSEEMRKRNVYINVLAVPHGGKNKEERIRWLIPRYEAKSIYHIKGECKDLEDELLRFPNSLHDDVCLVGETRVLTDKGYKSISKIKKGDMVLTRNGYKQVLRSWCTGRKEVISNLGITGTKDHPVITSSGVKELQYVNESDRLSVWNERLLSIEERSIIDTPDLNTVTTNDIITTTVIGKKHPWHYIVKFGRILMEKFLKGFIFIIKMVITTIMTLKTWSLYLLQTMLSIMPGNQKGLKNQKKRLRKQSKKRLNGTSHPKQSLGIENMPNTHYTNILMKEFVSAVRSLKQQLRKGNIVLRNVGINITQGFGGSSKKRKVYNLTVADSHEFFANGILVHNCDSLAYGTKVVYPPNEIKRSAYEEVKPVYSDIGL